MSKHYRKVVFWGLFLVGMLILAAIRNNNATPTTMGQAWLTDFEKARQIAAEQNKDLLINFAGTDWCYWCKRLDREVFADPVFEQEAGEQFVFVLIDFPRDKFHQSVQIQQQNQQLARRYDVTGFPTICLAEADGTPYARTGYLDGGAQNYIAHLNRLHEQKAAAKQADSDIP